jgi:hypothetical protein
MKDLPEAGDVFEVAYPFVKETYQTFEEGDALEITSWRPGCEYESSGPYGEDTCGVHDGMGKQILTVVDVHKPGRFPTRVFYTRKWISPVGDAFGKGVLRMCTVEKFRRLTRGFMAHDPYFEILHRDEC